MNIDRLKMLNNWMGRKCDYPIETQKEYYLNYIEKYKYFEKKYDIKSSNERPFNAVELLH